MKANIFKSVGVLALILVSVAACKNNSASNLKIDGQWEYSYQDQDSSFMMVVDVNQTTPNTYYAGMAHEGTTVDEVKFTSQIDSIYYSADRKSGKIYCINADTVYAVVFSDLSENTVTFINKGRGQAVYTRVNSKYTIGK